MGLPAVVFGERWCEVAITFGLCSALAHVVRECGEVVNNDLLRAGVVGVASPGKGYTLVIGRTFGLDRLALGVGLCVGFAVRAPGPPAGELLPPAHMRLVDRDRGARI